MNYFNEEVATQDRISKDYEYKRYAEPYSLAYHEWWAKKILSLLDLKSPILDNGCGVGFFSKFLKDYEVIGLDISQEMVKLAQKKYQKVVCGDSENMPFESASFQTVISRGTIHHLSNPQKGVEEVSRILADGGEAIFVDPLSNFINYLPRKLLRGTKYFSHLHKNFSEKEIKRIIESNLKIKRVHYCGYLAYPLLAAPDIISIYKFVPFKNFFTPFLIKIDELIAKIPLLNKQICWGIIIVAKK